MYVPKHFEQAEAEGLALIRAFPFAMLATPVADGLPTISHIPLAFELSDDGRPTLIGHVARANPHARALEVAGPALAAFTGPDGYSPPNWYPSKHAGGNAVPTWNYQAVHVIGQIRPLPDAAEKRRVVADLSRRMEGDGPGAWRLDDEPEDYVRKMLGGIVAFAIDIARIEAKGKLSQNRSTEDRDAVIASLRATGRPPDAALAAAMADAAERSS